MRTFQIVTSALPALHSAVARIAARAAKVVAKAERMGHQLDGYEPICMEVGQPFVSTHTVEGGIQVQRLLVEVTVGGLAPKLAGWALLATLQHEEAGVIVRAVPGTPEGVLAAYRNASPACDHCRADRRRKDTYIVQHEDGRLVQVGRTCLQDFTQCASAASAAALAALMVEAERAVEESEGGGGSGEVVHQADVFLSMVALICDANGWVSRTKARETGGSATADLALVEMGKGARALVPTPAQCARAAAALAFVQDHLDAASELSDYEHNLSVALAAGYVTHRTAGLIGSVISFHDREMGKVAERAGTAPGHFGQPGKRGTWVLRLVKIGSYESQYGATHVHTFRSESGQVAVWKTSTRYEVGAYNVTASVKEHGSYQGQDQTVLTRAKLELVAGPALAAVLC